MATPTLTDDEFRVCQLAHSMDFITDADFALLAGVKPSTADSWRRRGTGPDYVRLGSRFFYPRAAVASFLLAKTKSQLNVARGAL